MEKTEVTKDKNIKLISMHDEMSSSYLSYAMSVIVSRALPDVRDGLKPVHRRILYAMREGGYDWSKPYRKSARIVGDVMGQYHPHGDSPIYDSMVRMAQEFVLPQSVLNQDRHHREVGRRFCEDYSELHQSPLDLDLFFQG